MTIGASFANVIIEMSQRGAFDRECVTLERDVNETKLAGYEVSEDTVKELQARLNRRALTKEQSSHNVVAMASISGLGSVIMLFSVLAIAECRLVRNIASYAA